MAIKTYYLLKRYKDTAERDVPFYIEDVSGSGSTLTVNTTKGDAINVEYSTDNITWSSTKPSIPANGRVYIRANATYWNTTYWSSPLITSNANFNVGGNIMSLLYGSLFTGAEIAFSDNTRTNIFSALFYGTNKIISAEKLALPATTLTQGCYQNMFCGCSSLTAAPALPATTLTQNCYRYMFSGCTSLTAAPALPAQTLASNCYFGMFQNCSSLTAAPALPAQTLASGCYQYMFYGCSNLNSITVGATSWNTADASNWVDGVSATGTFTKPTNTTIPTGLNGIPSGWTVVNV